MCSITEAISAKHGNAVSTDKAMSALTFGDRSQRSSGLTSVTTTNDVSNASTMDDVARGRLDSCSFPPEYMVLR